MHISHTDIQIRFADIDALGHVNNATMQHYFDLGKSDFFSDVFSLPKIFKKDGFVQANINIDFIMPIYIQNEIVVSTEVVRIGNKSFVLAQKLYDKNTSEVKAESKSTLVCFDIEKQVAMGMPIQWRESLERAMNINCYDL